MNLNKYDAQGFPYTAEEAAERAYAFFHVNYLHIGYEANPTINPLTGRPLSRVIVKPYNIGRNQAKRLAKARREQLLSNLQRG